MGVGDMLWGGKAVPTAALQTRAKRCLGRDSRNLELFTEGRRKGRLDSVQDSQKV